MDMFVTPVPSTAPPLGAKPTLDALMQRYLQRLQRLAKPGVARTMLQTIPKYVLRNHLGEQAIRQAKLRDFSEVARLLSLLANPCDEHPSLEAHAGFPPEWASGIEIGCSS